MLRKEKFKKKQFRLYSEDEQDRPKRKKGKQKDKYRNPQKWIEEDPEDDYNYLDYSEHQE